MGMNPIVILLTALIPLTIGFIYYHPKAFGNAWMKTSGLTEESLKKGNFPIILLLCYVFSLFLAMALTGIVIHQNHIYSILINEPGLKEEGSVLFNYVADFMSKYGTNFRTFKHGAFHGALSGIFLALPIVGINALFERREWKYTAIHVGYWTLTLALMGGVICQFT
ncbi:DUF1761 domain-containing protein [Leptospira ognonensis]|uniref:DUF1761 domain-containing protein n=2 Tax=Leptospira ognonensis TaxID=2484945 RepID=A0A4R9K5D2_9LEPT|nr:DUF1761 domain-containing protein [Leptospira ognonensis]